ncbi:MAG: LysR family transcriptional regulator [Saccharofermentanales bacterium]|jgi:DNA-binding transcriptional LysR family regulator|nr:LysR family transcriptional regulator [Bacillota bacterium]NLB08251.1 LysR family transcriptional regulator [Clostridiales bacterium]
MDIQKINSFLTLARTSSFSKAADELYMSQPALSKQIKSLENELQVPLFHRGKKLTSLTLQGEYFLPYAENIMASYYQSREHILQIENLEMGKLIFGATNFNGIYLVPETLAAFKKVYKKIGIDLTINSSKNILNMLERQQLEFIILSDYIDIDPQKYVSVKWHDDELQLVVGKDSPLFEKESVGLEDLKDKLFISKDQHSSIYKFIMSELEFSFDNMLFISCQEAIKYAVIHGLGFSIMSTRATFLEEKMGLLKSLPLEGHSFQRGINIVYEKNKYLTPATLAYFKLLGLDSQ